MGLRLEGLDEMRRKLDDLAKRAKALDGEQNVPLMELMPPAFMRQYTDFGSFEEMLKASGFVVETPEDFEKIPDDEWDAFVVRTTRFENWGAMLRTAGAEWVSRKLGLR